MTNACSPSRSPKSGASGWRSAHWISQLVTLAADGPSAARRRALDPDRSPGDRFEIRGTEIYLWCPNGMARTKLTNAFFDRGLDTVSTARNWRTVHKLLELARA